MLGDYNKVIFILQVFTFTNKKIQIFLLFQLKLAKIKLF